MPEALDWNSPRWRELASASKRERNIAAMHATYGKTEGKQCSGCAHFTTRGVGRNYFKCMKFKVTSGHGTDWRVHWQACGLFERRS